MSSWEQAYGQGRPGLCAVWARLLAQGPSAPAVIDADGAVHTRSDLEFASTKWIQALPEPAALCRRRVALVAPNGLEWLAVFLALQRLGAVPILLDKAENEEGLRKQAGELGASWFWLNGQLETLPRKARLRRGDGCLVKVTSGSTGHPKALPFTQEQMLADGAQVCASMGILPSDRNLAVIPFGHSYGLGNLVLPLLQQGSPVVCVEMPLPRLIAEACVRGAVTVFPGVPALFRALVRAALPADTFASIRTFITAGAPMPPEDARAFREQYGSPVHNFYGSTETGGIAYDRSGRAAEEGVVVGCPLEGVQVDCLPGKRLRVRSPAVGGRGVFIPSDLGELSPSGDLRLLGRRGRLFKIAGRRLDLSGLEAELRGISQIREVVVLPHPERPEKLAAMVATDLSLPELRAALAGRVASWKLPERLRVVPELPLTPRGKTDRARVAALLA